jgi:tRNA threonylcarbamoyladenosine biosynthesis protein TsaE
MIIAVNSQHEMEKLGEALARACHETSQTLILLLSGELGAGKTTLVRGFLRGMQYYGTVKSPTYTLVEPYRSNDGDIYHFDLYRLKDEEELAFMGFRDYFHEKAICLVEWPEKAPTMLPAADLQVSIEIISNLSRTVNLVAKSNRGNDVLQAFQ